MRDAYDAYNMVSRYFPQISSDDVDAIADQIGALSVDVVASAVEGLLALAQLDAEAYQQRSSPEILHSMFDHVGNAVGWMFSLTQLEADDVDTIVNQIEALAQTT